MPINSNEIFSETQSEKISEILKAVAHPVRLRIVDELSRRETCVGDLARELDQKQAVISQQLKTLRLVGLVKTEKRDGKSFYSLNNEHLIELLGCMRRCVCVEDS